MVAVVVVAFLQVVVIAVIVGATAVAVVVEVGREVWNIVVVCVPPQAEVCSRSRMLCKGRGIGTCRISWLWWEDSLR